MQKLCGVIGHQAKWIEEDDAYAKHIAEQQEERAKFTKKALAGEPPKWKQRDVPIILHDIVSPGDEPLSLDRIRDQIKILNDMCNPAATAPEIPQPFAGLAGYLDVFFHLAEDPQVHRSEYGSFAPYDATIMTGAEGGAVYQPGEFLNIYVCNLTQDILGYAPLPQHGQNYPGEDGIVVNRNAFGRTGDLYTKNKGGKTLVHEVGHYLGLPHIWGESDGDAIPHSCDDGDFVDDTPAQWGPNFDKVQYPHLSRQCLNSGESDMFCNFMDVGPDDQLLMFTHGQVAWMREQMRKFRPWLGVPPSS